jgi:hypothetical protein
MTIGTSPDIAAGGVRAWQLPPDPSCAGLARSLLGSTMTASGLSAGLMDAAVLAVSEQATNSLQHGTRAGRFEPVVPAELWVWSRVSPSPQLVVGVVSLVSIPFARRGGLNVWVEPKTFTFVDTDRTRVCRPLIDLHDLTEHLLRRIEEAREPSS